MGKQHLDALAILPRLLKGWRSGQRSGPTPDVLVDAARDLARWRVGTAPLLEVARTTVKGAAEIDAGGPLVHDPAAGRQGVALGTGVGVRARVIAEVRS